MTGAGWLLAKQQSGGIRSGRRPDRISHVQTYEYDIVASTAVPPKEPSLVPIMAVVLIAFLIIGLALPVLPLHVHRDLGFGAFIVGLVTGSQFGASLLSRVWAGHYADRRGPSARSSSAS
jgi:hypothetical protein